MRQAGLDQAEIDAYRAEARPATTATYCEQPWLGLMSADLHTLIETTSATAGRVFLEEGALAPFWHAWKPSGESIVTAAPSDDYDTALALIRALFEIEQVVRYVSAAEAWMTIDSGQGPSESEVLSFAAEDQEQGLLRAHRLISRDRAGKPSLGALEFAEGAWTTEGRWVGLLPNSGTRQ
jgi:hypothetical protein